MNNKAPMIFLKTVICAEIMSMTSHLLNVFVQASILRPVIPLLVSLPGRPPHIVLTDPCTDIVNILEVRIDPPVDYHSPSIFTHSYVGPGVTSQQEVHC